MKYYIKNIQYFYLFQLIYLCDIVKFMYRNSNTILLLSKYPFLNLFRITKVEKIYQKSIHKSTHRGKDIREKKTAILKIYYAK